MYTHYSQRVPQVKKSRSAYVLPFFSIIFLGLIVIFAFQIVAYFHDTQEERLEDKLALHVISGRVDIKIWGIDQWTEGLDGTILTEGDALRTSPGSRAELSFLNNTLLRFDSDTEVSLLTLKSREALDSARVLLNKGRLWVKSTDDVTVRSSVEVEGPMLKVKSVNSIVGVDASPVEAVRVIDGIVQANMVEPGDPEKLLESVEIEFGQEVVLTEKKRQSILERKPAQLITLLSDDYRDTEWYRWNRARDEKGNDMLSVRDAIISVDQADSVGADANVSEEAPPKQIVNLPAPVILEPSENSVTTKNGTVVLKGTTSEQTRSIAVTITHGDKTEPAYQLQKYAPGETQWSYVASLAYASLFPGENRLAFVARDDAGRESEAANVTIFYEQPRSDLSAPKVVRISDATLDPVLVEGSIGEGIEKIIIDGYALSRFAPGSTTWSYFAGTKYGNLKEGDNLYSVYGIDFGGNRTSIGNFTIIRAASALGTSTP